MPEVITDNLDLWTSALLTKSTAGRGSNGKLEAYGIKKLRELILGTALRGLFDEKNESLSGTIEQDICNAKNAYYKSIGKKPKEYAFGPALLNEFDLPSGWAWKRVGDLCDLQTGATPSTQNPKYFGGDIRWLVSGDINQGIIEDCEGRITEAGLTNSNCKILPPNTVLIALNGQGKTRASVALLNVPAACNQSLVGIIPFDVSILDSTFLMLSLRYRYYEIRDITGQNQRRGLNMGLVSELSIPLPPLVEQRRIVAKVDELMALCDQLEQQQIHSLEAHQTLVETLLGTLTRVESQQEFSAAWVRIASHFDTLFTTEASIAQLKQTILQLAVMGKLVPQDPNDEPVTMLLKRVSEIKVGLVEEGKIKDQKGLPVKEQQTTSNQLPSNWQLVCLGNLVSVMDAGWSPACQPEPSPNDEVWGVLKTTAVQVMRYLQEENKVLPHNKEPKPQYEVKAGDILITRAGPKNRVAISCLVESTRPRLMISDKIIRFHLVEVGIYERYISLCLNAGVTAEYLEASKSGMAESQMNISQDKLRLALIPLCPINEQHRIVAKVDELMALCDALKARLADAQAIQLHLADAIVEQTAC